MDRRDFLKLTAASGVLGLSLSPEVNSEDQGVIQMAGIIKKHDKMVVDRFKNLVVITDNGRRENVKVIWASEKGIHQFMPDPNAADITKRRPIGAIQSVKLSDFESDGKFKIHYELIVWSLLQDERSQILEQCLARHNNKSISLCEIDLEEEKLKPIWKTTIRFTHQIESE
jgi:hypothetical protein